MEHWCSVLHLEEPPICTYPEPDQSSPCLQPFHVLNIHFNIVLQSTSMSSKWSPSLRFLHQTPVITYPFSVCATCPAYLILNLITRVIFGQAYRPWSSSLCSLLHSPVTSPLFGPHMFLSTRFSNTLILCFLFIVRDRLSHPYKIYICFKKSVFSYLWNYNVYGKHYVGPWCVGFVILYEPRWKYCLLL
jgi:hypothetical protein